MFKSFKSLNRYLNNDLKIKGLDFEQYSYIGAIRSLEVTFKGDNYHPHLHCIFAFKSPLMNYRYIENTFSNSKKNGHRKFTDFEVLLQKIWSLLNNKIKVTKKNIEELELGYSCTVDDIDESSAYEVFKYMTKVLTKNLTFLHMIILRLYILHCIELDKFKDMVVFIILKMMIV